MNGQGRDSKADRLELEARALARLQSVVAAPAGELRAVAGLGRLEAWLEEIGARIQRLDAHPKIAEWLLDNRHQLTRAVRQIERDLPSAYYARLPSFAGDEHLRLPRVYHLARSLATLCALQVDLASTVRFVAAYQEIDGLKIGELWALPTMLRIVCMEVVVHATGRAAPSVPTPFEPELEPILAGLEDTERIGRAIRGLAAVSSIPWRDFVDRTSVIDAVLRGDPVAAYTTADFDSRDRYRRAVEQLAEQAGRSEHDVAGRALARAAGAAAARHRQADPGAPGGPEADDDAPPQQHVGHWLVGDGREEFERAIGARVPVTTRLRRAVRRRAFGLYLAGIAAATAVVLALPIGFLWSAAASPAMIAAGILLTVLPAHALAISLVQWLASRLVAPDVLFKLDFERGIPERHRTAVVVPAVLTGSEAIERLAGALEQHALSNPDPSLAFVLLSDFADAEEQNVAGDDRLLEQAASAIRSLNAKYSPRGGGRFHLAHRERRYNPRERCWMGWERKRGKLEEWNRLLRGEATSYVRREGDEAALAGVRFVLTLDADTVLPRGVAARLAGVLAHPLNRPRFDPVSGRLCGGYTVVQPRVEIEPAAAERSLFTRLYAGDSTVDIYSRAVSDVYQDLFATGIYVGKGIYDLDAFARSLEGWVPENALLSHDLFEGIHGRAALATDIVVYEDFPPHYLAFARRMHRWVRGDWQLLPWLRRRVPTRAGASAPSGLSPLGRWLVLDNMRRGVAAPALLAMLVAGWLVLPGNPLAWTLLAAAMPSLHSLLALANEAARRGRFGRRLTVESFSRAQTRTGLARVLLLLVLLPFESLVAADAVVRALVRVAVTRRHLLQWQTASQTASCFEPGASRTVVWSAMATAPAAAVALAASIVVLRPAALPAALWFLVPWLLSPEIAHRISLPWRRRSEKLADDRYLFVRRLARRTWLFFETFVGPEDHWLPPDNYQEIPTGDVDHRTSPTNIAMLLASTGAAWDLGYIGARELASRLAGTLATVAKLERVKGHLLNWYETRTLAPLSPRYVSTVDSGNLSAVLIEVSGLCRQLQREPVLSRARWDGLMDALSWLEDALARLVPQRHQSQEPSLAERAAAIRHRAGAVRDHPGGWSATLTELCDHACADLDKLLLDTIAAHKEPLYLPALHELRIWLDRVHRHMHAMHADLQSLLGWLPALDGACRAQDYDGALAGRVLELLPATIELEAIPERCALARRMLPELRPASDGARDGWIEELDAALAGSGRAAAALTAEYRRLAELCQTDALAPDFAFLYDDEKHLFHIGYNAAAEALDPHYYDLLASECRLASYLAIAKGDVPVKHWFHLGRPVTRIGGTTALLSWGGTMFEYLMPRLLLRGGGDDLLSRSEDAAIDAQRAFGRRRGVPWGVSESGFAQMDAEHNYQYRAFGVHSLGFKRETGADLVVAPYATALAVPLRPATAVENILALRELGAIGEFGLHEAIDFTRSRVPRGRRFEVVRSYMAHHQGMALTALSNYLCDFPAVRRFHLHPLMRTVEVLLHERVPVGVPIEFPAAAPPEPQPEHVRTATVLQPWRPVTAGAFPELHVFGNGRLSTLLSDSGAGGIRWLGRAITRWTADATLDDSGVWLYVRDLEDGELWSVGRQPCGMRGGDYDVVFLPHMADLHRRSHGIAIRMQIGVAPADDVEIRHFTVTNESERPRRLSFVSYGEAVLARPEPDQQHPAFSKLFVSGEEIADLKGVILERRARDEEEQPPVVLHRLVCGGGVRVTGTELSRERFLGRLGSAREPALGRHVGVSRAEPHADTGLDAIFSVEAAVELNPGAVERFAFVTLVGSSRRSLVEVAERYDSVAVLEWALGDAGTESAHEAVRLDVAPAAMADYQRLLSLLLQVHPALRGDGRAIAANRLSQHDLWRMAISGDVPILLVTLENIDDTELLSQLVRAHHLWARRGVAVDLVVLHTGPSGYEDTVADTLHDLLQRLGALPLLRRSGGIHLVRADQVRPEDLQLLEAVARVRLDGAVPLARQLADVHQQPVREPPFTVAEPQPAPPVAESAPPQRDLLFGNDVGGFSADGRQYVVELLPGGCTPAPWCNVLANDGFGTIVSESGGGYTWAGNASERRLSPWRNDPVRDLPAEALYLRDEETGAVWMPMAPSADCAVEVHHEAGLTTWQRTDHGLEQRIEVFVDAAEPVKVVRLRLRDRRGRPRRVTATYYVEWVLAARRGRSEALLVAEYDHATRALLARNPWSPAFAERVAFLVADREPHGFTTDRCEFLGREGDLRSPAALSRQGLSNSVRPGCDPCAALQVHLDIAAGTRADAHFALGEAADRTEAAELTGRWRDGAVVESALAAVLALWEKRLSALTVRTPEPALDVLVNRWLLYQTLSSRVFGRTGYYQSSGAYGFRDQLQDVMALLLVDPAVAREHILECARRQFTEGDVLHWWHPPEGRGVRTHCSDDLLWLPFAVAHYVESTGDAAVLEERVPFLVAPPLPPEKDDRYGAYEHGGEEATLFEHCLRALERGLTHGPHGLPLIGGGDWNDGMNRVGRRGRGESVWLAWFAIATAHAFARLCQLRGEREMAGFWTRRAEHLAEVTEAAAWDGRWYRRAYDDDGRPWGSAECDECRIDSIAQSWAILCGAGDRERARTALESAQRELLRGDVACLLWPPFYRTARDPGYIKAYPPGVRENGGQYSHAAAWLALALATAGDGEAALRVLRALNPIEHSLTAEAAARYRVEPYVVAADIFSVEPYVGRGGWTWYTGSAAWTYRAVVEGVLGLRLQHGRLRIDPCLPPSWPEFHAVLRTGAGATIELRVDNPQRMSCGIAELVVDGRSVEGDCVDLPAAGAHCDVYARIGEHGRKKRVG